jgi:hypothetical protein
MKRLASKTFGNSLALLPATAILAGQFYADEPTHRSRNQDLYTDFAQPIVSKPVGWLDRHVLIEPAAPGAPLCVSAPDNGATNGAADNVSPGRLCLYQPVDTVEARAHRQSDGSVRLEAEAKVPTAGWAHGALVRHASRYETHERLYALVACRPDGMVAQVSALHAQVGIADAPAGAFTLVITSGNSRSVLEIAAKPQP